MTCSCQKTKACKTEKWNTDSVSFSDLRMGDSAIITGYKEGSLPYKSKLFSMGLVRGVAFRVLQIAPLGDPIEIAVMSYRLSLRKKEADILNLRRL